MRCSRAFERGIGVTLIADGHTTFDTPALRAEQIVGHHNWTLSSGGLLGCAGLVRFRSEAAYPNKRRKTR